MFPKTDASPTGTVLSGWIAPSGLSAGTGRTVGRLDYNKKSPRHMGSQRHGATGRIRTGDLLITNQLLYRLSHSSVKRYDI